MEMEPLVSLGSQALLHTETAVQDQSPCVLSSTPDHVEPQQPVKKQTRKWAAWTRQEEESFFTALRQFGKNFEKITKRVQSKNKDQVRHYYYRLVKRMNKLLDPELCLDAKNSKDTNAAMLRWWSLLEKYSCKASKLHLKPRRFKIFIEALENQLMKDRKRNERKRPSQGESSPTATSSVTKQNRASAQDAVMVKLVLIDGQNIQKLGASKGSPRRNVNVGVMRNNNKGSAGLMKPPRQKRKQSPVTPAAYRKWEKAAIAGVSLVADAAEHLERTTIDKDVNADQAERGLDPADKELVPLPVSSHHQTGDSNVCNNMKLKLQFFPIDDTTRRALEMDKHNPHLELTLSARKKMSSVLEHLNRKWGNSSVASGDLMLFPYSANRENLLGYQRWAQDTTVSAADIHNSLGNPPVFRLRYGWFSDSGLQAPSISSCTPSGNDIDTNSNKRKTDSTSASTSFGSLKVVDVSTDQPSLMTKTSAPASALMEIPNDINGCVATSPLPALSCLGTAINDGTNMKQLEDGDELRLSNGTAFSAGEWADSLTNISVGDLLSEVATQNYQCLEPVPFSCDSFDAAIAAHISKHQNKLGCPPLPQPQTSSIWDADETCDAFSFQKNHISDQQVPRTSNVTSSTAGKQDLPNMGGQLGYSADGDPMDESPCEQEAMDNPRKDFSGLSDVYWPDSLGPLDLDIQSSDMLLNDSLGGLNRLIASSLDAFQNCSFLGLEKKKDSASTTLEARDSTSSFSGFKVGSGV
ncbi:TSL-kinase interacting protein 1 [Linum grandiflorum]